MGWALALNASHPTDRVLTGQGEGSRGGEWGLRCRQARGAGRWRVPGSCLVEGTAALGGGVLPQSGSLCPVPSPWEPGLPCSLAAWQAPGWGEDPGPGWVACGLWGPGVSGGGRGWFGWDSLNPVHTDTPPPSGAPAAEGRHSKACCPAGAPGLPVGSTVGWTPGGLGARVVLTELLWKGFPVMPFNASPPLRGGRFGGARFKV